MIIIYFFYWSYQPIRMSVFFLLTNRQEVLTPRLPIAVIVYRRINYESTNDMQRYDSTPYYVAGKDEKAINSLVYHPRRIWATMLL